MINISRSFSNILKNLIIFFCIYKFALMRDLNVMSLLIGFQVFDDKIDQVPGSSRPGLTGRPGRAGTELFIDSIHQSLGVFLDNYRCELRLLNCYWMNKKDRNLYLQSTEDELGFWGRYTASS